MFNVNEYQPLMRGSSFSISLHFLCRPKEVFLKRVTWFVYFAVLALVLRLTHDLLELTGFPDFVFQIFFFYQVIHVLYRCVSILWCTLFHTFQVLPELDEAKRKHLAELFVLRTDTCRTKLRTSKEALVSVISSHVRVTTTFLVAAIRTSWIDFD